MTPLVEISANLGYRNKTILEGIDVDIYAGEAVLLVGVNGAGKTTTLRTLAGELRPISGAVRVMGQPPHSESLLTRVAYAADSPALYSELTGYDHIDLMTNLWQGRVDIVPWETLNEWTGIAEFAGRPANSLSAGQRQRLYLALSVMTNPAVLLLDEPFNSLDFNGIEGLRSMLGDITAAGGCVIFTSHLAEAAAPTATRVLVLRDGALVADEATDERALHDFLARWHRDDDIEK